MIHVFLTRICGKKLGNLQKLRGLMYKLIYQRWLMESARVITEIRCNSDEDQIGFQRLRRIKAEEKSVSEYYVLADDDCLLENMEPCLDKAVDIMERHPDFAILSWRPINATIIPWEPIPEENGCLVSGRVHVDKEVSEHSSVGGIRLIRKGAMTYWPDMEPNRKNYDHIHCGKLRQLGWRSGYFNTLRQLHIGRHYSTIINSPMDMEQEYTPEVEQVLGVRPQDGSEGVMTDELMQSLIEQIKVGAA